jgi:hypothetical protein
MPTHRSRLAHLPPTSLYATSAWQTGRSSWHRLVQRFQSVHTPTGRHMGRVCAPSPPIPGSPMSWRLGAMTSE